MSGYVKIFSKILDSTIWVEDSDTRIVWVTMLAMADRDGIVESTVPGLARRAKVSLPKTEAALQKFQEPDKYSWSSTDEGRRIRKTDRGWLLINYETYREMLDADDVREKNRLRQERHRQRKRNVMSRDKRDSNALSQKVTPVTPNNDMHLHLHLQQTKNPEGEKDLSSSGNGAPPPKYTQDDFDERDIRKLSAAELDLAKRLQSMVGSQDQLTEQQFFEQACELAGITVQRGLALKQKQRRWPGAQNVH